MEVLELLPIPSELIPKIMYYVFQSPHTNMGVASVYNKYNTDIVFNTSSQTPKSDEQVYTIGHIGKTFSLNNLCDFSIFQNLYYIDLRFIHDISGDICHYQWLPNLKRFCISGLRVYGDIYHLNVLKKLEVVDIRNTSIDGDIAVFASLPELSEIFIQDCMITGDVVNLQSLTQLSDVCFFGTNVYGNVSSLHRPRNVYLI
jgi:hypothetical protein